MPTKNINLTDHYNKFIEKQVKKGRYNNASEVIRASLHLLEKQNLQEQAKLKALQEAARVGFKDIEDGQYVQINDEKELENIFDKIEDKIDKRHAQKSTPDL